MKNSGLYFFWIVLGAAFIAIAFSIRSEEFKAVSGVLIGVGAGLAASNFSRLMVWRYEKKHPDIFKQSQIERQDERNQQIRWKSKGKSGDITQWFILGLAYVMILLDLPLWLILVTIGIYVLKSILEAVFIYRFQKEM